MNISEFSHPLNGSEKRNDVEFVDLVGCKVKIKGQFVDAYLIGGISIREEDYQKLFS